MPTRPRSRLTVVCALALTLMVITLLTAGLNVLEALAP